VWPGRRGAADSASMATGLHSADLLWQGYAVAHTGYPITTAIRALRAAGVPFQPKEYSYMERGGTAHSARALEVDEHLVIKTLVMENDIGRPLLVLMHGDRDVSAQKLARSLGCRDVHPCGAERATQLTGYLVGGTSPFGTKRTLPIYAEQSILELPTLYINGGKRGFLVQICGQDLARVLNPTPVEVASP
jgi:Cys-tRNA(Pro) deacylase